MVQINFTANERELDFLISKLGLNKDAQQSISLQIKSWLLQSENVTDLETQKQELQIENLKKRNENLDYKNRIDSVIADSYDSHESTFGKSPSKTARRAIRALAESRTERYDENALHCPDCTWHTDSKNSLLWQIDRLTDHVKNHHKRPLSQQEANELAELIK